MPGFAAPGEEGALGADGGGRGECARAGGRAGGHLQRKTSRKPFFEDEVVTKYEEGLTLATKMHRHPIPQGSSSSP